MNTIDGGPRKDSKFRPLSIGTNDGGSIRTVARALELPQDNKITEHEGSGVINVQVDSEHDLIDSLYQNYYDELAAAQRAGDSDAYRNALNGLLTTIGHEVNLKNKGGKLPINITFMAWNKQNLGFVIKSQQEIRKGNDVTRRTSTLNVAHMMASPDMTLDQSYELAQRVIEYLNARGRSYIHSQLVDGKALREGEEVTPRQIETIYRGFGHTGNVVATELPVT